MASSVPLMNQVQRFQNGGPIATLSGPRNYDTSSYGGLPTELLNILPGVNISPPANERATVPIYKAAPRSKTGTSLRGRSFIAPNRATNPGRAAELELARRALEGGLGSLSAGEQAYLSALMGKRSGGQLADSLTDYLGDSALSNIIQSVGEIGGTIAGGVGGGITGLLSADKPDQETLGGRLANATPDIDYLRDLGFEFPVQVYNQPPGPPEPAEASRPMFQGPTQAVNVDMSDPAVRARIADEQRARAISDAGGMVNVDPTTGAVTEGPTDDIQQLIEMSQAAALERASVPDELQTERFDNQQQVDELSTQPFGGESKKPASSIPVPTPRPDNFAALVAASRAKTDEATAAREKEEDRMRQGQLGTIQPRTKEEIADVINNGTKEEQQSELKQLMNEFTQNAPKYEGLDKGLAIAKIGFAMAAGKSPDAIQNIASALEDGADMFIKDKQQRDAFNRQVQLSALQYGMGEISKGRAQERLDKRTFTDFVNGSDKPITYKGVKYAPGRTIRISNADYLANDGKLPEELITEKVYTSNQTAITARAKAAADAARKAVENRTMSVTDQRNFIKDYTGLVKKASEAETAGTLIETVIMKAPKIVGAGPAIKQAGANFLGVFGISAPKGWNAQKLGVQDLKAALQSVVPATLGSTQSANSISNRDVELLIQGFLADGIMTPNKDGTFAFVTTTQETFINGLKNGLRAVRTSQAEALQGMTAIDDQLLELYTPGGRVGSSLTAPLRGEGIFAPGGTAAKGVKIGSMKQADDGIWDVVR